MFIRGGLLIEPWKPFHYYTNDVNLQSVVLFEDVVYACNTPHQSGATFAENSSKFTSAGSGGNGGFVYGGELDATPVSTANIAVFDALTNCTIVNNVFTPEGYATACATHIAQEVDAKAQLRFTWPATDENTQLIVGLWTPTSITNMDELSATGTAELVAISCVGGILMQTYKELNNSPASTSLPNEVATGDSILITLEYGTNILSFVNETQNLGLISCDLGNFPSFAESRSLFIFGNTPVSFDIANNDYPALQLAHEVQAPENSDGKTYLVTGANENSVINGKLLKSGDFVTFFANGTDCVVSRLLSDTYINSLIESQVLSIISTELSANPNGTLASSIGGISVNAVATALTPPESSPVTISEAIANATEAILATKHFNSYGGEWNAGGQYDGRLNFTPFTSYVTYSQNTFGLTGDGTLQDDGKYWGLVRDTTASLVGGGLSFDLIIPFINHSTLFIFTDELVVEFRQTGTFGDLSANQKFFRFSFINLDNTGSDPTQIQLTVTYCNGNGTIVSDIAPTLAAIGQRMSFDITQNVATAYAYITENAPVNLISADPNFTATDIIAYVGFARPLGDGYMSFVLTQGPKDIRLPTAPRLYKTYKAISTDAYSTLYGKTIKDNDLVTFILDSNNNEDILVESAADLSYTTRRGDFLSVTTSSAQTTPLSVDLTTAYLTNLTDRAVEICNFTTVSYTTAGDPFTAGIAINFNTTANGFDVGRSYAIGEIMQVAFDTRGGNAIQNITFESPIASTIGPFTVDAEKYVVFTFTAVPKEGTTYGTTIRCIGKWEL